MYQEVELKKTWVVFSIEIIIAITHYSYVIFSRKKNFSRFLEGKQVKYSATDNNLRW